MARGGWLAAIAFGASVLTGAGGAAHEAKVGKLRLIHPHTLAMPGSGERAGRFVVLMTIENLGSRDDALIKASSPVAPAAVVFGGAGAVAGPIALPAGQRVALSREGARIELSGVTDALSGYETFLVTLTFEKAGVLEAEVMVEDEDWVDH